jgi:hypothetical protein
VSFVAKRVATDDTEKARINVRRFAWIENPLGVKIQGSYPCASVSSVAKIRHGWVLEDFGYEDSLGAKRVAMDDTERARINIRRFAWIENPLGVKIQGSYPCASVSSVAKIRHG